MDPILARRLAKQKEKLLTGESAVENIENERRKPSQMEPELARRLAKQQAKVQTGESAIENVGSAMKTSNNLDPELIKRLERQQRRVEDGKVDHCADNLHSAAEPSRHLDPELLKRLARQQMKVEDGKVDHFADNLHSVAEPSIHLDPELLKRLARQQMKVEGIAPRSCTDLPQRGNHADHGVEIIDSQLAKRLSLQRMKADGEISSTDVSSTMVASSTETSPGQQQDSVSEVEAAPLMEEDDSTHAKEANEGFENVAESPVMATPASAADSPILAASFVKASPEFSTPIRGPSSSSMTMEHEEVLDSVAVETSESSLPEVQDSKKGQRAASAALVVLITATLLLADRWLLLPILQHQYHDAVISICKQVLAAAIVEVIFLVVLSPWFDEYFSARTSRGLYGFQNVLLSTTNLARNSNCMRYQNTAST